MRAARNIVNSLFSVTASHLAALSPSVGADVYKAVRSFTAFMGRPLPEELDPRVVHGTIELIADGLRRTPYGSPLELEYPLFITLSAQSYCPFACTNCYSNSGVAKARGRTDDRMQLFAKVAAANLRGGMKEVYALSCPFGETGSGTIPGVGSTRSSALRETWKCSTRRDKRPIFSSCLRTTTFQYSSTWSVCCAPTGSMWSR
jgi:hypothetical protein